MKSSVKLKDNCNQILNILIFTTPQKHLVSIGISYFVFEVVHLVATKFLTRKNKWRVDEILMTTISKNVRKT